MKNHTGVVVMDGIKVIGFAECPYCEGHGCEECSGTGVISREFEEVCEMVMAELEQAVEKATGAKPIEWVPVAEEGDVTWLIAHLEDGRWAALDDAEIAPDRVEVFATREEAVAYLWGCWEDSLGDEPESERVRWLAGVPQGVPSLEDLYHRVTGAGCDLLDDGGTPLTEADIHEMGGDALPVRITWYDEPEPLIEDDDPPLIHPRWRATNCNWRSTAPAWDESRAKIWGEVVAGRHRFAVVGEEDPR